MTAYFVAANGAQTGPFTLEEIQSQCSRGIIQRDTFMWRDGLGDWQSAEQVLRGTGVSFAGDTVASAVPPPFPSDAGSPYTVVPEQGQTLQFSVPAASLSASRGTSWIGEGWKLFVAAPGLWIVALLIWLGIQILLGFVPVLGSLASLLLGPSFVVGLLAFAHGISSNGNANLGDLFAGFKDRLGALIVLSLLNFALMLAVVAIGAVLFIVMIGTAALPHEGTPDQMMSAVLAGGILKFLLLFLIVFAMLALVFTAYMYAPALVFYVNLPAGEAMKESFAACWRNWQPLLVMGLIFIPLLFVGALTFGLGLLVVFPLLFAANYASFKDMFGEEPQ